MIDIRKQPALIECINMVLSSGHKVEVKREKDYIVVIGVDATASALEAIKAGKMTATVKQDGDAMGKANIEIALNYLETGSWLEGTDYPLAADGYSVRIPYAKITAESMK